MKRPSMSSCFSPTELLKATARNSLKTRLVYIDNKSNYHFSQRAEVVTHNGGLAKIYILFRYFKAGYTFNKTKKCYGCTKYSDNL